jgi:hypothetical protein
MSSCKGIQNIHIHTSEVKKAKLSMCLTKYHAMIVLNYALYHEHTWESEGITPCILDLATRWRRVVSFKPRSLYCWEKSPSTHWIGGWVGPRASPDAGEEKKKSYNFPCQESNTSCPAHSLVTILTELPWKHWEYFKYKIVSSKPLILVCRPQYELIK